MIRNAEGDNLWKTEVVTRWKEYLPKEDIKTHTHTHSNVKQSTKNINSLALQVRKKYYKQLISLGRIQNLVWI